MGIKHYKPTSPGIRQMTRAHLRGADQHAAREVPAGAPHRKAGRNVYGRITVRHRGGGHKRMYRIIDFKRNEFDGIPAKVVSIEYDPNRTCRIALVVTPTAPSGTFSTPWA